MCVRPRVVSLTRESQDKNLAWSPHQCSRWCSTASRRWQHSVVLQLSPSRPEQRAGMVWLGRPWWLFYWLLKGSKDNCFHWNRTGQFSRRRLAYWIPRNSSLTPPSTHFHSSYFSNSKPSWFNFLFTQATERCVIGPQFMNLDRWHCWSIFMHPFHALSYLPFCAVLVVNGHCGS